MDNWSKLEELVDQGQFELILEDEGQREPGDDLRLVYLMNDAVESFLVFRHASMTGQYIRDFEGEIRVEHPPLQETGERECLILHQEEQVVTIFFDRLDFEAYLFNYSQVGHFWVEGNTYLRQLEFKIAILGDKYRYIGEEACTQMEKRLAALYDFPPLSCWAYPAVPKKYIVPREKPWMPTEEAIAMMRQFALEAGDRSYARWLGLYRLLPTRVIGRVLAAKLHRTRHIGIAKYLMECFAMGCEPYPLRYAQKNDTLAEQVREAKKCLAEMREQGMDADLFVEEPFWFASDGITGKVYLGRWKYGRRNTSLEIEEYAFTDTNCTFGGGISEP